MAQVLLGVGSDGQSPRMTGNVQRNGARLVMGFGWSGSGKPDSVTFATMWVVPEPRRCVQCGICSFHCPMSIDVRRHVWRAEPVKDSHCLTCGECVRRCPRGLLRFQAITPLDPLRPDSRAT